MNIKRKILISNSLILLSSLFISIFSSNPVTSQYGALASTTFGLDFSTSTLNTLGTNATTDEVFQYFNSISVSGSVPGSNPAQAIAPISSVDTATVVRYRGADTAIQIGANPDSGLLAFSIKEQYRFTKFNFSGRFINASGTVTLSVTGEYAPVDGYITPSNYVRTYTLTTTMSIYEIDLTNVVAASGSIPAYATPHLIRKITFAPTTSGNNTHFVIQKISDIAVTTQAAQAVTENFETKVLSFTPCASDEDDLTILDLDSATALRNEYLSLNIDSRNAFNSTAADPNGAYQRYLFICSEFELDPFSAS